MTPISDHNFATCYMELCRQQRTRPLPMICVTMPHLLDFTTDRVKMDDWKPILNSLSLDQTLKSISIRSKYQCHKFLDEAISESKVRSVSKAPVILTRYLIEGLSHSLNQCIRNSPVLTSLELEGIPIPIDCLGVLCVGLASTKTLQYLSLQRCHIGDSGCELLCQKIADVLSIRTLNLSHCGLTFESGAALASALSKQKLALYHDAWMQSLRYREPKLDSMPGLRRLTLNGNNKLGDQAVTSIIEAIKDSLWFKALDIQQCGLTESISKEILELLKNNNTLVIVDVRLNPGLSEENLTEISRCLSRNELRSKSDEYQWLSLPQSRDRKRVSSAGSLHNKQKQNQVAEQPRPRSATIRQVKRPAAPIRKTLGPVPQIEKRIKLKPPVPIFERRPRQALKPLPIVEPAILPPIESVPKISLHLDLQSQIQSFAVSMAPEKNHPIETEESMLLDPNALKPEQLAIPKEPPYSYPHLEDQTEKMEDLARQLLETQTDRDRLLEELQRVEQVLKEERSRREFAETKLRTAKRELEEALHRRERDSRGYLLINQKSMKEICMSFTRLLDMLDTKRKRQNIQEEVTDEIESLQAKEDIKKRFALIIRKTKSENLKREIFVDESRALLLTRLQMQARYGSSEGNIRTIARDEPIAHTQPLLRLKKNVGDPGGAAHELPQLLANFNGDTLVGKSDGQSSKDRARALFASIMNGDGRLGLMR